MKSLFVLIFLVLSLFLDNDLVGAKEFDELNLPKQIVNPGDFYYPAKRLWEKIRERLNFNNEVKYGYYKSLSEFRMSELGFVVKNKRLGEVERASQRFAFYAGTLTEHLMKYGTKGQKDEIRSKFKSFVTPLDELRDNFPANSSFWMLVQHDINSLKEYSEKLAK